MSDEWLPAEHGTDAGRLQHRVTSGLTWTIAHSWGVQAITFIVFIILARLLTPEAFGIVALALVFVSFAQLIVDQGLGDALIQRPRVTKRQIDTAFWAAMTMGALLTAALVAAAGPISAVLNEPELEPMLRVLALTFVLAAMTSIQVALLRRDLRFKALAVRALAGTLGGGVIGVAMALMGFGAWALVGQQLGNAALSVVVLWRVSPWRPGRDVSWEDFRSLFGYGANVMGSDILMFLSRYSDNFLIGVFLGTRPLGLYAVGYRILGVSQSVLVTVARRIAFPAFSKLQHDPERMVRAYFRVTRTAAVLILPSYVGLAIIAPELTVALVGQRWAESGPVASILFLTGPVLSMQGFSGAYLNAVGHPNVVFRFRLLTTLLNVVGFAIAVRFGIVAVAAAFTIRAYMLLPLNLYWMRSYGGIPIPEYLRQLRGLALATALMAVLLLAFKFLVGDALRPIVLVAVEVAGAAIVFAAALWLIDRRLFAEMIDLALQVLRRRTARRRPGSAAVDGPPVGADDDA